MELQYVILAYNDFGLIQVTVKNVLFTDVYNVRVMVHASSANLERCFLKALVSLAHKIVFNVIKEIHKIVYNVII